MTGRSLPRRVMAVAAVPLLLSGCAFHGVNSLPLPGAVATGSDAVTFHVRLTNIGTLESNSPVMVNDVIVGSVGRMEVNNWHADLEIRVKPQIVIPANVIAAVGQTSLLGSQHLALNPPLGEPPSGRLSPGATIGLDRSTSAPTTEQTLSALSTLVNGGGLGQIGDIVHNFNAALSGHETELRDLLARMGKLMSLFDDQRDNINVTIAELNRLAATFADQRGVLDRAVKRIPQMIDVLNREKPRLVTALDRMRTFMDLSTTLVNDTQDDLVRNLKNLEPTIKALADVGPDLGLALSMLTTYPSTQDSLERTLRGDYTNMFASVDLTVPRLKRTMFRGTRWGDPDAQLIPAPGEPWYLNYSYDPLSVGIAPPPPEDIPAPGDALPVADLPGAVPGPEAPPPPVNGPVLPVVPPVFAEQSPPASGSSVFAGPYGQPAGQGGGN